MFLFSNKMCRFEIISWLNFILFCVTFESQGTVLKQREFFALYKWSHGINMTFPTVNEREFAISNGYYDINRIQLPVDIDVEYKENNEHRTFLTIPRLNFGIPYSLAIIREEDRNKTMNPKVEAYPRYELHKSHGSNCSAITSALRTYIDECQRLWIIDSGQINALQWCAPQILVIDLKTDEIVHRYKLPSNNYRAGISVYTDMIADVKSTEKCMDTKVYISDAWGHGLIVYNMLQQKSWRIEHDLMKPDRTLINNGHDGIFTVSLSPKNTKLTERYLYFHSLNSFNEISIPLKLINNDSLWYYPKGHTLTDEYFSILGSRGTQCESEIMDNYGNLYCSLLGSSALISWREGKNYTADDLNVVAYGPQQWRFVTGLKLTENKQKEQELWALSTEPKLFVGKTVRKNLLMYQIIGCRIRNLLRSELCTIGANDLS